MMTKWYEESEGVVSSKRVAGAALAVTGLVMKVIEFIVCLTRSDAITNISTADSVATSLLGIGAGLLGCSTLENIAGNIGAKNEK